MPTPAEEALAEGFAALSEAHAKSWTFGGASFAGVVVEARPDDPRMPANADEAIELLVAQSEMPDALKKVSGVSVSQGSKRYTLARPARLNPATSLWSLILTA